MRFWRELRNPALKCVRIGHKPGIEFRRGYRRPQEHRYYVCDGVTEERDVCLRCKVALTGDWRQTERQGFTGFSWPKDQADAFRRDGEYWSSHGFRNAA